MQDTKKPRAKSIKGSRSELAALIAALLAHPLTPARLYENISDFINDESSNLLGQMYQEPAFIERVLERGGCGFILCPGKRGGVCPGPEAHKKGGAR
jgi:hypothetical protein